MRETSPSMKMLGVEPPCFEKLRTQAYSGSCGTCDYAQGCGGCRARAAYYHDGDILAQDDYCGPRQRFGCGRRLNRRHRKDHS